MKEQDLQFVKMITLTLTLMIVIFYASTPFLNHFSGAFQNYIKTSLNSGVLGKYTINHLEIESKPAESQSVKKGSQQKVMYPVMAIIVYIVFLLKIASMAGLAFFMIALLGMIPLILIMLIDSKQRNIQTIAHNLLRFMRSILQPKKLFEKEILLCSKIFPKQIVSILRFMLVFSLALILFLPALFMLVS